MAAKNGKGGAPAQVQQVQQFVKGQLEEAQKRFQGLEEEAQRVLGNLLERGRDEQRGNEQRQDRPLPLLRLRRIGHQARALRARSAARLP